MPLLKPRGSKKRLSIHQKGQTFKQIPSKTRAQLKGGSLHLRGDLARGRSQLTETEGRKGLTGYLPRFQGLLTSQGFVSFGLYFWPPRNTDLYKTKESVMVPAKSVYSWTAEIAIRIYKTWQAMGENRWQELVFIEESVTETGPFAQCAWRQTLRRRCLL